MSESKFSRHTPDSNSQSSTDQPSPDAAPDQDWYSGWEDFSNQPEAIETPFQFPDHLGNAFETDEASSSPAEAESVPTEMPPLALVADELLNQLLAAPQPTPETIPSLDALSAQLLDEIAIPAEPPAPPMAGSSSTPQPDLAPAPKLATWEVNATPAAAIAPPGWNGAIVDSTTQPQIAELVSLIQELNQCNSALIDRVSQLEEALEQNRAANSLAATGVDPASEVVLMQEQVNQLLSQLEFTHQTNQRQQILIETLTHQLEGSQERIAQLERECSLVQQRNHEHSQLLSRSEAACRDLRARLHRQQRYTLQYKAALEKSLEAPLPSYGIAVHSPADAYQVADPWVDSAMQSATPSSGTAFLPKVVSIQPWAARDRALNGPVKLESLLSTPGDEGAAADQDTVAENPVVEPLAPVHPSFEIAQAHSSVMAHGNISLPTLDLPASDHPDAHPDTEPTPETTALETTALEATALETTALETTLLDPIAVEADVLLPAELAPEAVQAGLSELESALADLWMGQAEAIATESNDPLWQALAQLMAVPPVPPVDDRPALPPEQVSAPSEAHVAQDDGVAPLAEPTTTPEGFGSAAIPTFQPEPPRPLQGNRVSESDPPVISPVIPPAVSSPVEAEAEPEPTIPAIPGFRANWPAPVVYPLRPSRKISSLAAVELPSFPKG